MTHLHPTQPSAAALLLAAGCFGCAGGDTVEVAAGAEPPSAAPVEQGDWERQAPEFLAIAERLHASSTTFLGRALRERLETLLRTGRLPAAERRAALTQLAEELLRAGENERAIELLEEARGLAAGAGKRVRREVLALLATAWLRQAEVQNCVLRHNASCCIFPLAGEAVHVETGPAEKARATYLELLELTPGNLKARWLLNVAAMALGRHPDAVPARYRIPVEAFASEFDVGRFVDVAPELGLDAFSLCGGVVVDDLNGDALLDILTSTYDPSGPLVHYRNLGNGRFEDVSDATRASDQLGGLNLVAADYDNDGARDVFVLRGAWLKDDGQIRNSLLRNLGDGTLADVTRAAGLAEPARPTQTATWADVDNDGDLDLYVGNESRKGTGESDFPSQLFLNRGDGTFQDVAEPAGVTNDGYAKGTCAGDFDNDGDQDLFVSNVGPNRLYRNLGGLEFRDDAPSLGVVEPAGRSFACWFFDYDNSGWLDLFVAAYDATVNDVAAAALGLEHEGVPPRLYRNIEGTFSDVAGGRAGPPLQADGGELRRPGPRRMARRLLDDRRAVVPGPDAERDAAQRRGAALSGRHDRRRFRALAEGTRRGLRGPGP